LFIEEQNNP